MTWLIDWNNPAVRSQIDVLVVDLETTGLKGYPDDLVVNVGVVGVNIINANVIDVYDATIHYDTSMWTDRLKDSWIFSKGYMKLEDLEGGEDLYEVAKDLKRMAVTKPMTSYNLNFDFGRFLDWPPFELSRRSGARILRCLMKAAAQCPLIPRDRSHDDGKRCPKLETAYKILCPDDPAQIGEEQRHLGLYDARMAGCILIPLLDMNYWNTWQRRTECD